MKSQQWFKNYRKANELNKTKICMCDNPQPQFKNSENGMHHYCGVCIKEYKGLKGSYKGE